MLLALLAPTRTRAQPAAPVPPWSMAALATAQSPHPYAVVRATAVDEAGNVFIAGSFGEVITFGSLTLHSAGSHDFFLAKYVPATNTWVWAVRGGGRESDAAYGLAVQGGGVYVTGFFQNNYLNDDDVTLDSTAPVAQPGATHAKPSVDMFIAKYFDHGPRASLAWCQIAGGTDVDYGTGIAVCGRNVYVTGTSENDQANTKGVVFGSGGPLPGLHPQPGTSVQPNRNLVLAKYTDYGTSAAFGWSRVAGGDHGGQSYAVAVQGNRVYVAGALVNSPTGPPRQRLGPGHLASPDLGLMQRWLLAKYTDQGDHATLGWCQTAGGNGGGVAYALAVSGRSVYVLGDADNDRANSLHVRFGSRGLEAGPYPAPGLSRRVGACSILAKYTDHGTTGAFNWLQVDGGSDYYRGQGLVVRGPWVYTLGYSFFNRTPSRQGIAGGSRRPPGTKYRGTPHYQVKNHSYVAGYLDAGDHANRCWVRVFDYARAGNYSVLALHGPHLYVVGATGLPARFGRLTLDTPQRDYSFFVAALDLSPTLGPAGAAAAVRHPNARSTTWVSKYF